jgi:long-chain acyl-CoA synthetase
MRESVTSLIIEAAARGEQTALIHRRGARTERWSYGRLARTAFQLARELESRQIGKGDRVLIWSESCTEWIAAFFGCLLRGAVVVPLDEQSAPDFAQRVREQTSPKLILCGAEQRPHWLAEAPVIRLDLLEEHLQSHSTIPFSAVVTTADDLAEIIFTSGTTAEPKGVCLSHGNLLANIAPLEKEIAKYIRWERPFHPIRFLVLPPPSHVFGQFMGVFVPQLLGGEVFLAGAIGAGEIIALVKQERISVIAAVPRQLQTLREKLERDFGGADLRSRRAAAAGLSFLRRWLRFRDVHTRFGWKFWAFVAGGATLEEETETFWRELGFAVVQGYGMTETASLVSVNHPFKPGKGSIGKMLPGQEMKLAENGEILVRGANVSTGYWRNGSPVNDAGDGWLRTGDIGELDAAGNLYFKGRQKDVIVTAAGLNLFPDDLEAALNKQPEVRASCVFGVDGASGPEPMAAVVLHDDHADLGAIVERANRLLNASQRIQRFARWPDPDFPRTSTQKVRKNLVKQMIASGVGVGSAARPLEEILARLTREKDRRLDSETTLSQGLKLDSLAQVELAAAIEERFQIELDEAAITPSTTIAELERLIQTGDAGVRDAAREYPYPRWSLTPLVRWIRLFWYYLLIFPITRLLCWVRTVGREQLDDLHQPALFISNHVSMVDHGLILSVLPWRFRHRLAIAMEGERLRSWRRPDPLLHPVVRLWMRIQYVLVATLFNVFPMPQKSGFRRSFAYAGAAVDRGYSVLVFPEGRTTDDGRMKPFMQGIGLLAEELYLPIVPLRIEGLYELKKDQKRFAGPGAVRIIFGEPVQFDRGKDPAEITKELETILRAMKAGVDP